MINEKTVCAVLGTGVPAIFFKTSNIIQKQWDMSRILTDEHKADAARLKSLYQSLKKELKLSQILIADQMGMTQSAVGHYITGRQPLNARVVSDFARILGVGAEQISPSLAREIARQASALKDSLTLEEMARRVMVIGKLSPNELGVAGGVVNCNGWLKVDSDNSSFALGIAGNGLWPRVKNGEFVVLEKLVTAEPGDDVVVLLTDGSYLFKTLTSQRSDVQVVDITGKSAMPELVPADSIDTVYFISAIVNSSRYYLE
ncbi:TPA: helix-turn-helix domain-containing protein [Klebsiella aerogenes]|nr:XRE family transcriptional regulator [Klebsiella aerogenes]HCT3749862.1 XRE family transcriptional regulator [Klebsiella aerogenes]HCT8624144.1 XRE family transcriptional regulator [Klebsiella aerogenes]HCT8634296.1 XRE family transcriptional regulator [Klebsiella aerogenes]HCT8714583.1 XRE family transcriptional regulator [Klebsiella aerogenes]